MGYVISRQGIEGLGRTFGSILPSISYELVGGHACGRPGESLVPSLRVDFYCCIIFYMSAHEDKIEELYMKCVYKHHCLELGVNERLFLVSGTLLTVQQG